MQFLVHGTFAIMGEDDLAHNDLSRFPQFQSHMPAALERGDAELAKRSLHTLKGASANVGFDDLSRQAAALMTELPDPDVGALGKLMMTIAGAGSVVAGLKAEFVKTSETNEAEAVQ